MNDTLSIRYGVDSERRSPAAWRNGYQGASPARVVGRSSNAQLRLSDAEYQRHRDAILGKLADRGLDGLVCFNPNNIRYFCRWGFIPTERPIAYALTPSSSALLVPRLEEEHAGEFVLVDKLRAYPEYPGDRHPMQVFKDILIELGLERASIGVDAPGYGGIYGYRGPQVKDLLPDAKIENVNDDIEYLEMINSPEELALIAESARWGNLAHVYLQEYCRVGVLKRKSRSGRRLRRLRR